MNPYDIERIFSEIEENIIRKMIDAFRKTKAKGEKGKYAWKEWRLKQLKSIKNFIKGIRGDYSQEYEELNKAVHDNIAKSFSNGVINSIEEAVENTTTDQFAYINRTKIDALQKATMKDLKDVEGAVFRRTEDIYRQIVYKSHVALNSGLVTYEQAVDMATREFIRNGINCVVYKNGSKHTVPEYVSMVLRTAMQRATLMAEGEQRTRLGVHTVYAKFRKEACPLCMPFLGRLMIDDVYSVGTEAEAKKYNAILLSRAMEQGFLHPNCKDTVATYFPETWVNDPEHDPLKIHANKRLMYEAVRNQELEQKINNARMNVKRNTRLANNQLDEANKEKYKALANKWYKKYRELLEERRKYENQGNE